MFIWNNDLKDLKLDNHNLGHLLLSCLMCLVLCFTNGTLFAFLVTYAAWFAWEIGDGFKPWYTKFKYNPNQSKFANWLRENFLYSNGFSYQDAFVWNLLGTFLGLVAYTIITIR